MKKYFLHKNTIIILIAIGCICVALNVVMYNALDTNKRETEKRFTFNELILEHKNEAFKELIEKAIEVDGIINEITFRNNKYTLILSEKKYNTLILCEMQTDQNQKMETLHVGGKVKIKGVLKGVLMDVIVLNCIILEKEIHE